MGKMMYEVHVHSHTVMWITLAELSKANSDYEDKLSKSSSRTQDKVLFKLAWKVQELEELAKDIQQLVVELKICKENVMNMEYDLVKENYAKKLGSIRENVESAVR